jgi:predicted ABC-type ATPase
MSVTTPDVIVIRGAPGSGKSQTAKCLATRLGKGARVEIDRLRAMVIPIDWTNQSEHINILSLGTGLVAGFLRLGHRPVIVVDTFSGDKLVSFFEELLAQQSGLDIRVFALVTAPQVLRARVESRPADQFKDIGICQKLNSEVAKHSLPGERLIDNTLLTPEETVDVILGDFKGG